MYAHQKDGIMSALREEFTENRGAADFLEVGGLQKSTGASSNHWGNVVIKELLDNALDAAESASGQPVVSIKLAHVEGNLILITVTDNGDGMSAGVID